MGDHVIRPDESRLFQIKEQTLFLTADYIVLPAMRVGLFAHDMTKSHKRSAIVPKSFSSLNRCVTGAKDHGERDGNGRPSRRAAAQCFIRRYPRKKRSDQQRQRRDDRKYAIDSLRRNKRHHN